MPAAALWPAMVLAGALAAFVFVPDMFKALTGFDYPRGIVATAIVALLILPKGAEFLKAPWALRFSGDSSYTVYLSHAFAIGAVTQIAMLMGFEQYIHPWLMFIVVMATCIVGGGIAYWLIERPMGEVLKGALRGYKKDEKS